MLGFAVAVTDDSLYESVARRGIERVAERDSVVLTRTGMPLVSACNELLDEAAEIEGLEALVVLHQDTELRDGAFATKVRARFADPDVAIIGALGVRGVRAGAMWMPRHVGYGRIDEELFGAERAIVTKNATGAHEVEAADGFLLVLSPWAVQNLRFDPAFDSVFHSYDLDFCFQARACGKKVVVEQIDVIHRRQPRVIDESLKRAATILRRKWTWNGPGGGPRALRSRSRAPGEPAPAAPVNGSGGPPPENGDPGLRLIDADRRRADALQSEVLGHGRRVLELDRAINGDGGALDLESRLADGRFDVVVVGAVLGRLSRPEAVLALIRPHLAADGFLLVRVTNAAHLQLRASRPWARAERTSTPVARRPRRLTQELTITMLRSAGYHIGAVASIEWDLASELDYYEPDRFSTEFLRRIVSDPDIRAVEYLTVASPADRPTPRIALDLAARAGRQMIRPLGIAPAAAVGGRRGPCPERSC